MFWRFSYALSWNHITTFPRRITGKWVGTRILNHVIVTPYYNNAPKMQHHNNNIFNITRLSHNGIIHLLRKYVSYLDGTNQGDPITDGSIKPLCRCVIVVVGIGNHCGGSEYRFFCAKYRTSSLMGGKYFNSMSMG